VSLGELQDGLSLECGLDCLQGGVSVQAAGRDDGEGRGVEAGAPLGAEAAGDLAEDDAGAQRALSYPSHEVLTFCR
jgi:hypothetical protein